MTRTRRAIALPVALVGALIAFAITTGTAAAESPYSDTASVSVSTTAPTAGHSITITVTGFKGGEKVVFVIHSDPVTLGTATANSAGAASLTAEIPDGFSGTHSIVATGQTSGVSKTVTVTVQAASSDSGGLASTGVAVIGIGSLGAILLIVGGIVLLVGNRRSTPDIPLGV